MKKSYAAAAVMFALAIGLTGCTATSVSQGKGHGACCQGKTEKCCRSESGETASGCPKQGSAPEACAMCGAGKADCKCM